ncbi:MAG: FG-GAP-like repeat-containing protein [Planctomycetota bacterium]|nr:FG-GAP-like repeat-containing protein [Planctomycetota bacterium]
MQQMLTTTFCTVVGMTSMLQAEFLVTIVDSLPSMPGDAVLGDVNGDGMLDLVTSLQDRVLVQLNGGDAADGTWPGFKGEAIEWRMHGTSPGLDVGDATGDGIMDVLLALPEQDAICILVNAGESIPSFSSVNMPITGLGEGSPHDVSLGNYSITSEPMIAVATGSSGALTFRPTLDGIAPADVDVVEDWTADGMQEELHALPVIPSPTQPKGLMPGDIDPGGGKDEDVVLRSSSTMYIKLPNMIEACMLDESEQGYTLHSWPVGMEPVGFALADLDRDGFSDLVTANAGDDTLSILRADHSAGFSMGLVIDLPATPRSLCAGDFDGDGDADVAVALDKDGATVLFLRNESEIPGELELHIDPVQHEIESIFFDLLPGDVDGDGIVNAVVLASPNQMAAPRAGDRDGDGVVGSSDLVLVLEAGQNPVGLQPVERQLLKDIIEIVAAWDAGSDR